ANWNDAEVLALVNFLWEHRAQAGDGGTFKDTTFNAVAEHITKHWATGPPKTAKHCKTKWAEVTIITYKETTSGTHWDNNNGASIDGEAASSAWNNYINASKIMATFWTKGWPYFDKMQDIMPNTSV
ncbi:hypothetical protein BYT27DRAFT_7056616, partial [Phlegmacium glaucopus]